MAATRETVLVRWPTLSEVTDQAQWDAALADAALQVAPSVWGEFADLAQAHLAAHLLFISHPEFGASGQVGPVASETVGSVSRSYAVTAAVASRIDYGRTLPGQAYLRLRAILGISFSVA